MTDQGQARPAGWKKDPTGRHFGRYWDGEQWTDNVISAGKVQSLDPMPERPEPSLFPDGQAPRPPSVAVGRPSQKGRRKNGVVVAIRGWPRWAQVAAGIAVILVIAAAASGGDDDETVSAGNQVSTTQATLSDVQVIPLPTDPPPTPAPTVARTTTVPGPKTEFGNGTHRVGVDIAPGTYVAAGGTGCYWERQSVFGGGLDSIIANDLSRGGQVVVTIAASDKGFKTSGCGTWKAG
jgi:hypothetical protein